MICHDGRWVNSGIARVAWRAWARVVLSRLFLARAEILGALCGQSRGGQRR